ncbi:hypothetical protein GQ53DRAFT_820405 [Thozetella sp. PMI_491]|nr:hypothetical protein GQ53DRAFT_820405 [Thozetella sp. PMI_491]
MRTVAAILGAATLAMASPLDLVERAQVCLDGEIYTSPANGEMFQVTCGYEAVARDIGSVIYYDNANACYDKCATTTSCVGVSWTSGSGTSNSGTAQGGPCYLKSKVINIRPKVNARIAKSVVSIQTCINYQQDPTNDCPVRTFAPLECQNFPDGWALQLSSTIIPAGYSCEFYGAADCPGSPIFTMSAGTANVPTDQNDKAVSYTCAFTPNQS